MRYPKEHKSKIRTAIVRAAARLFRRRGYARVSIDGLMASAGLTRGGFYGHFRTKADLYKAVLADEHDFVARMQARTGATTTQLAREGLDITQGYLNPAYRSGVIRGCALASLAMDTARATKPAQRVYAQVVRDLTTEFCRGLDDAKPLDERALGAIATCIGGLLTSSACAADRELSDAISRAAAKQVEQTLGASALRPEHT